ncbi:MAG TPA: hypothetical protein VKU87_11270 [Thermomicrobiaceae bacterium]|nr:hypothetical protein [Thermomicrobiaceae bacterium]
MATPTERAGKEPEFSDSPTIVTATRFEYLLTRLAAPRSRVICGGLRLERLLVPNPETATAGGSILDGEVILSGLAGSLVPELAPGSVLIPSLVADVDGNRFECDPRLVERLRQSARSRGFEPRDGHLLTAPNIVTGIERQMWAERGFAAVEMEAVILARTATPFATVRVILDSPSRSLSRGWEHPAGALASLDGWREVAWLAAAAPLYTLRSARIAATASNVVAAYSPSSRAKL